MNSEQLIKFKAWFDKFVAGFCGRDEFVNANIRSKQDHTKRVCREMLWLADELGLNENQRLLAETIALFHDVGRFPQFIKYKTYNDTRSVNHCELAIDVIRKEKIFAELPAYERELIETAIKYHGSRELPPGLTGDTGLFCKMIRDADKLDIYNVVINAYMRHRDDPDNFNLEIEFPDLPRFTPAVLDLVLAGRLIDYKILRTWNDMKLCILSWVYDVNFPAALARIKQCRCLEAIFEFLPDNAETAKVREKIIAYVDNRTKT